VRILFFIIFLISVINLNTTSHADQKIVFLNVNYIFNNSKSGIEANKSIEKKIKKLETDVNKFSKDINSEKEKLIKQKNVLSENDFKQKLKDVDNKIKKFNGEIKIRNEEIVNLKKKVKLNFSNELKLILSDFSTKNSIQLIVKQEDILMGSKDLDITNEILKILDSNKIVLIK
tara:strand:- start:282 stop:803 length:522 start_codon:yes stop_codon:yes gene_type:complete